MRYRNKIPEMSRKELHSEDPHYLRRRPRHAGGRSCVAAVGACPAVLLGSDEFTLLKHCARSVMGGAQVEKLTSRMRVDNIYRPAEVDQAVRQLHLVAF